MQFIALFPPILISFFTVGFKKKGSSKVFAWLGLLSMIAVSVLITYLISKTGYFNNDKTVFIFSAVMTILFVISLILKLSKIILKIGIIIVAILLILTLLGVDIKTPILKMIPNSEEITTEIEEQISTATEIEKMVTNFLK